jgi:hypothetical protein
MQGGYGELKMLCVVDVFFFVEWGTEHEYSELHGCSFYRLISFYQKHDADKLCEKWYI